MEKIIKLRIKFRFGGEWYENKTGTRQVGSKRVSLVSACVTLSNVARPLFIGVVSACQPLIENS